MPHPFLIKMCEVIVHEDSEYEIHNEGWNAEDKRDALVHLKALESFEFVYVLLTLQRSVLYLKEAAVRLQGENQNQDIISGYATIEQCCTDLRALRADVNNYAKRIFKHSHMLAEQSGITVAKPHHSSTAASLTQSDSVEQHFQLTVIIPFLDQFINDLSSRFDKHAKQVALLQGLLPIRITPASSICDIEQSVAFCYNDLPNAAILDEEFHV